jgi:hypothetical protein
MPRSKSPPRYDFMPVTIGSIFKQIVKDLKTKDTNPNSCLNNPKSDLFNPNYDLNNPNSPINNQYSCINDASNNEKTKNCEEMPLENSFKCIYPTICLQNKQRNLLKSTSPDIIII